MGRFIADFHIHSHYSLATSKYMNISSLTRWGQLKGIQVMGTGDFTHPAWFKELQQKLEPAEPGLLKLQQKYLAEIEDQVPSSCQGDMRFIPSVEISCIYKKNDRVRKMHCLVLVPSLKDAATINAHLARIGNLQADGRPILGLDAKELLKIVKSVNPDAMFIPAHIWTPHFALFGSRSGFDSIHEAFDELVPEVTALETGLSSDPAMNWGISELDNIPLVSNSDAHSAYKLGREANVLDTELSYYSILEALRTNNTETFIETIEFFPEEGKYHMDGHRKCNVRFTPQESKAKNGVCPQCNHDLVLGVVHQIDDRSTKRSPAELKNKRPFRSIIPLPEIIAEVEQKGVNTKTVERIYHPLLEALGNEFDILLNIPLDTISEHASPLLAEAVKRMREGTVHIEPGFDGEYGSIHIITEADRSQIVNSAQTTLL